MNDSNARHTGRVAALVVAMILLLPSWPDPDASAHEIPVDVTVQMFVVPLDGTLHVLVRVPLEALRDSDFPQRGPGYLNIREAAPMLRDAAILWVGNELRLFEDGRPITRAPVDPRRLTAVRVSIPSDRSWTSLEEALAHVHSEPLPPETELVWRQALLDLAFEYPIDSARSEFSIDPSFAHLGLRTLTLIRFRTAEGVERAFQFSGNPGRVRLDPSWYHAAWRFVVLGFWHILDGVDHLLFLLCLVVPFRQLRPFVALVTAFTVAHSITLIASASGLAPDALWFPPLIETLIAASIVYMAFENILGPQVQRRWVIAFAFGLVHGFGFSFILSETMQFAGGHLLLSLVSFNVGVELGQLFVLLLAIPVLEWLFRHVVKEQLGTILISAIVAHGAWHWMSERGATFLAYDFRLPAVDSRFVAALMRWSMLIVIMLGAVWLLGLVCGRLLADAPVAEPRSGGGGRGTIAP